jgi:uncharacterized protein (TIGR03435 family)
MSLTLLVIFGVAGCLVAAQPAFEVASIRPTPPGGRGTPIQIAPGGRFTAAGVSVRSLIKKAYDARDFQISGGPGWVDSERYDIVAKAEHESSVSQNQLKLMLQAMLADRFKLVLDRETKEISAYVLTIRKGGPKLKEVTLDEENTGQGVRFGGLGRLRGTIASMSQLAEGLSDMALNGEHIVDRPVLDRTGLTGVYDFSLLWTSQDGQLGALGTSDPSAPSLFTAVQEQLGLKLEAQKAPVEMFVIKRVEKPSGN